MAPRKPQPGPAVRCHPLHGCRPAVVFATSFALGSALSAPFAYWYHTCSRPRRVLHELLRVCRDAAPEAVNAAYYLQLKRLVNSADGAAIHWLERARHVLASPAARALYEDEGEPQAALLEVERRAEEATEEGWSDEEALAHVEVLHDVAPKELWLKLDAQLQREPGWSFQGTSNAANATRGLEARFWYLPLFTADRPNDALTLELWREHIEPRLPMSFGVLRAYANGELFGIDGSPHADATPSPPHFTLLYYPHSLEGSASRGPRRRADGAASRDAGGETVFFSRADGRVLAAVPARENSAVLFPGCLVHAGRAPGVISGELRVTVAFKLLRQDG